MIEESSVVKKVEGTTVVTAGPQVQKRLVWVDIPEYEGFEVQIWANHPQQMSNDLISNDVEKVKAALLHVITAHNGWLDYEGTEYPAANTPEFWEAIPTELAVLVMQLVNEAVMQLPNSQRQTRRR